MEITPDERARLDRILSVRDLESQRKVSRWFWGLAAVLFVAGHAAILWDVVYFLALITAAFAAFMIGCARRGYYKLFRLIHYQNAVLAESRGSRS